ncbi:MAG: tRNA (guanine-N(7)-)-methyltransferase [Myxococcota bacterium]|nr:tRNA (guanine-N(7)-)-methyltransferase [Myxococcota bacterium]
MRIRQHVNPNQAHFARFRGDRPPLDHRLVEVEIGCAEAQFLFERAAADPTRLYVGLEIREDLTRIVNRRARALAAPVHAVFCQAQLHISEIFPAGSIERVYLNFPDPWFKRRHHERRMIDDALASGIAHAVRAGGDVFVQTDVWEIALDAMATFDPDERFENVAGEWTFWKQGNPYGVRSWREQNAEETGLPIWRIMYRRA